MWGVHPRVVPVEEDDELEMLRQRRLRQLEAQQMLQDEGVRRQESMEAEMAAQRQAMMRQILSPEARERIGRLRTAHPELAASVEDQLLALAQSGRLGKQVTDGELRSVLRKLAPKKREINITIRK